MTIETEVPISADYFILSLMKLDRDHYQRVKAVTRGMLDEAIDAILEGVGSMFKDLCGRLDGVDKRFDKVDRRLDRLEVCQSYLKDQINGLKANLSDTPSRREFQELKTKVDKYHPLSK